MLEILRPGPGPHARRADQAGRAACLASDQDTRMFLVTGPLSAIGGLHERFRP